MLNFEPICILNGKQIVQQLVERGTRMRILVADDHEVVRKGVCTILTSHFHLAECIEASNGQDALDKALSHLPDVAILDINMPLLGGFGVAREIRRLLPQVPILFFTMHTGEQFVLEARKAGVQGLVAKDRAGEMLIEAVEALLRKETFF
jgi:DNA-binding NarL/FixJ family response regulator